MVGGGGGYLKHLSMTNNNERRLRASEAGGPLSRVAPAVTRPDLHGFHLAWWRAQPAGSPSLMSVPLAVLRHGAISDYVRRLEW